MGLPTAPAVESIALHRDPGFRTLLPCSVWGVGRPISCWRARDYQDMSGRTMHGAGGAGLLSLRNRDGSGGKEDAGTRALCPL